MPDHSAMLKRGYLDLDDGQVHFLRRAGSGIPIILLHQTASSSKMWQATLETLNVANPLWALDTPGFGSSFDPEITPQMADYTRWLAQAMDRIADVDGATSPCHLIGHHTGASIALALAVTQASRVASLALIGPQILTPEEREAYGQKLGAPFRPGRSGAYLLKNWEYLRVGGADAKTELLHREMIDMLRGWSSRPHAYRAVWAQDTAAQLREVTCPLHLISSPDDLLFAYFERARALRPDALCTVLSGGANFTPDLATGELVAAFERSAFYQPADT